VLAAVDIVGIEEGGGDVAPFFFLGFKMVSFLLVVPLSAFWLASTFFPRKLLSDLDLLNLGVS